MAIYVLLRSTVLNFTEGKFLETTTGQLPLYLRLLTTSKVFMIYLRLLFLPLGLHMEWDIEPARSFFQDEVFLSVIGLFVIGVFTYLLSHRSRLKFFAISWFFIMLFPYSNVIPLNYFMGEGWLYLPSIGFFTLGAVYLSELARRSRVCSFMVIFIVVSLVVFYGILTFRRADLWADPIKLYTEVLRYSPNNTKARINLGVLLAEAGSYEEAEKRYKEAAKLLPDDASVHSNLATIYAKKANMYADKKMYDLSLEQFEKAITLNPEDYVAYNNIGIIYKQKGNIRKAMESYTKALEINPNYPLTYNNIGNIYLETAQYEAAIRFYKKAINLDPNKAAFYANLGKAYRNNGMTQKAKETFQKALQLDPAHKDAADGLGSLN
jgi:tetratricopeptide (TPR) repeat protein